MSEDDMTCAKTRRYLAEQVDNTSRDQIVTLAYLDIDNMRSVNDGYGRQVADDLLIAISKALTASLSAPDFVARLSGDEFCIVLHGAADIDLINGFVKTIRDTHICRDGREVSRTASIGVAQIAPHETLVDGLLIAENAIQTVKKNGGNGAKLADSETFDNLAKRRAKPTIEVLRQAVEDRDITYFVQPIWDLEHNQAIGVEALIRWVKDQRVTLLPEDFIDIMTRNYRHSVRPPLEEANRTGRSFASLSRPIYCAFNISSRFMEQNKARSKTWATELLNGLPAEHTVFEITETTVIADPDHARGLLADLREAGVRLALDDFGTGLSNLERLKDYPVDIVKVDRMFVREVPQNPRNKAILKGLVSLSKDMGFDIVAEGVETLPELDAIKELGIRYAQGFYLGRPEPVDHWLAKLA